MSKLSFSVRGFELVDDDNMLSLNKIHAIAGSPSEKRPNDWRSLPSARDLVAQVASELNTGESGILKSRRGKGGGTWAHWKIALAYAAYLDPALHSEILETYKRVKTGDLSVATETVRRNTDPQQLALFQKDLDEHRKYIDSYWGVHNQLKAHDANEGKHHAAYNSHVNRLAGVETGKRDEADRRQVLKMRLAQDAGELTLMDSDSRGWGAVHEAKDAGTRVLRALPQKP